MKRLFVIALSLASLSAEALACPAGYYTNVDGNCVQRPGYLAPPPYYAPRVPPPTYVPPSDMPSAQCADGTYSYSQHRSGTCSHHGGVAR